MSSCDMQWQLIIILFERYIKIYDMGLLLYLEGFVFQHGNLSMVFTIILFERYIHNYLLYKKTSMLQGFVFNTLSHDSILLATSNTNRYRTSFFSNLSMALFMQSMGITSIMHLMSLCAAKFNISCVSSTPPIKLPPILLLPREHFKLWKCIIREGNKKQVVRTQRKKIVFTQNQHGCDELQGTWNNS